MKKRILALVVFGYVLFLSGCSFSADIVVVNNSDKAIQITYKAKSYYSWTKPEMVTLNEFNVNGTEWKDMPVDRCRIDEKNKTVEVQLGSGEALRLARVDAGRAEENLDKEMDLSELKIESEKGLIELKGDQIAKQFKPEHRGFVFYGPSYSSFVFYYTQ